LLAPASMNGYSRTRHAGRLPRLPVISGRDMLSRAAFIYPQLHQGQTALGDFGMRHSRICSRLRAHRNSWSPATRGYSIRLRCELAESSFRCIGCHSLDSASSSMTSRERPQRPIYALPLTASRVTVAAISSLDPSRPSAALSYARSLFLRSTTQLPRHAPPSLSLGSLRR
jgi:hypothetical protein